MTMINDDIIILLWLTDYRVLFAVCEAVGK